MTVALNIMMAGALTGANFNPAISLGPMIATANFTNAWLYVIAPIVGALVAAFMHKALRMLAEDGIEVAPRATAPAELSLPQPSRIAAKLGDDPNRSSFRPTSRWPSRKNE